MNIRTRLTLWNTGVLALGLLLVGAATYYELFIHEPREGLRLEIGVKGDSPWMDVGQSVLMGGIPALLASGALAWWFTRRALNPITRLMEGAERIHAGNLVERLPRSGHGDELDRLAEVLNAMTSRLADAIQQVRDFTLHASHELKTPLAVMRASIQASLRDAPLDAAQRESAAAQLAEIDRLAAIVEALALLTRADAGTTPLRRAMVRLDELVRDVTDDAEALGERDSITVTLEECQAVIVEGDRHRLRQVLLNLADNAVKYNIPKGRVGVRLRREDSHAVFSISNTGSGVPLDLQSRLFERFFRGDAAHSRDKDGCGLGLSIAQALVRAHDGEIELLSEPGGLTTVTVRLPAALES